MRTPVPGRRLVAFGAIIFGLCILAVLWILSIGHIIDAWWAFIISVLFVLVNVIAQLLPLASRASDLPTPPAQPAIIPPLAAPHSPGAIIGAQRAPLQLNELDAVPVSPEPLGPPFDEALLPVPETFIGRRNDLEWVLERLRAGTTTSITAVGGMGGIGKTTLVAIATRQLRREGRFTDGIVVVHCEGITKPTQVVRDVLARFDPLRHTPDTTDHAHLIEVAQRLLHGKATLVVLDNVEPELATQLEQVVQPLRAAGATLVLTARQVLPRSVVPVTASRELDLLSPAETLDLFATSYGHSQAWSAAERAAAEKIVELLGRHTLAVKLAGAYAADAKRDLIAFAGELEADPLDVPEGEIPRAVALVFTRSTNTLPPEAFRLFAAFASFATPEFGRGAALALGETLGIATMKEALDVLVLRALVEAAVNGVLPAGSDRERLRLHPLLRAFAATCLTRWAEGERVTVARTVAEFYAAYANQTPDSVLGPDEANIVGALDWAHTHRERDLVALLCYGMMTYWRDRDRMHASLRYLPWGIAAARSLADEAGNDERLVAVASLLLVYGQCLNMTGQLDQSESPLQESLAIFRRIRDQEREGVVLAALGYSAMVRGDMSAAESRYRDAIDILRGVNSRREQALAEAFLGHIAHARGRRDEAEAYYREILPIYREFGEWRGESVALSHLGQIALERAHFEDAESLLNEALKISHDNQDRRGEGATLGHVADLARARGDLPKAEVVAQQALIVSRQAEDHQTEAALLCLLSEIQRAAGHPEQAKISAHQALKAAQAVHDRRTEAHTLAALGELAYEEHEWDEAGRYYRQALGIDQEVQNRQGEGVSLCRLGQLDLQSERAATGERLCREGLAILRESGAHINYAGAALQCGILFAHVLMKREEGCALILEAATIRRNLRLRDEDAAWNAAADLGCDRLDRDTPAPDATTC